MEEWKLGQVGGVGGDVAWGGGGGIGIRCVLHPTHLLLQQTHNKRPPRGPGSWLDSQAKFRGKMAGPLVLSSREGRGAVMTQASSSGYTTHWLCDFWALVALIYKNGQVG